MNKTWILLVFIPFPFTAPHALSPSLHLWSTPERDDEEVGGEGGGGTKRDGVSNGLTPVAYSPAGRKIFLLFDLTSF